MESTQRTIQDFVSIQPSVSSDKTYVVLWDKDRKRFVCTDGKGGIGCDHERKRSEATKQMHPCRHVLLHINDRLRARAHVLESRHKRQSKAVFDTFEQAMEHFILSKNEEASYLCNLALSLAYTCKDRTIETIYGEDVHGDHLLLSDDVYQTVGGEFHTEGIMGIAFGILAQKRLIRSLGRTRSETPTNHGAKIDIWQMTKEGMTMFEAGLR